MKNSLFWIAVAALLIVLKTTGVIPWSWLVALIPVWGMLFIVLAWAVLAVLMVLSLRRRGIKARWTFRGPRV